jgi:hypothetical protein
LRPLIGGNVTIAAFAVAMLTRLFNVAQRLRGGIGFPANKPSSTTTSPRMDLNLQPGEVVRVRDPERIFETLDRVGKNRGLWFDRDMLKHTSSTSRCSPESTGSSTMQRAHAADEDPMHRAWTGSMLPARCWASVRSTTSCSGARPGWSAARRRRNRPDGSRKGPRHRRVPVYNGERFLRQCLDSLLSQTYRDFVLVISDNASTDGTRRSAKATRRRIPGSATTATP